MRFIFKIVFAIYMTLCISLSAFGKEKGYNQTKNIVRLVGVYNTGNFKFDESRRMNSNLVVRGISMGLAYRHDMYILPNNEYLSLGLRVLSMKSKLVLRTDLVGFDTYASAFTFAPVYTQVTLPLLLGKNLLLRDFNNANLDMFIGASIGATKITSYSVGRIIQNEVNNSDKIGSNHDDFAQDVSRIKFSATADGGFQVTPFGVSSLSVGCIVSYNITSAPNYKDSGAFGNLTQNKYDYFTVNFSRKFINVLFTLNYSF